jgi:flagellar biosynthetic protein FliR
VIETGVLFFALVLARVGTFVGLMPLFSGRGTPRIVRVGLAMSLAVFWLSTLVPPPELMPLRATGDIPWVLFGVAMVREAILGAMVALLFSLFFAPVRIAGEFITQQIGLSQSVVLGPTADTSAGPFTLILETLAGFIFLELNGHHVVLAVLHSTFAKYPLGGLYMPVPTGSLVEAVTVAENYGVLLAGPLALAMFLVTITLAILARVAPQLNIYSIGFTLQALVGVVGAFLLIPDIVRLIALVMGRVIEMIRVVV